MAATKITKSPSCSQWPSSVGRNRVDHSECRKDPCDAGCRSLPRRSVHRVRRFPVITVDSLTGFIMAVQPTSDTVTFQATMGNQTFTASGVSTPRLSPGTHTLSGTFSPPGRTSGEGLIFIFVRDPDSAGGVRMGSLRSLAGPVAHVASCFAVYVTSATTTATQSFSLQFEVTADAADACPQPG